MSTLWHGRFERDPTDALLAFTVSLPFDRRLAADDIRGSRAHCEMLAAVGLITDAERDEIVSGLDAIAGELEAGTMQFLPTDEDIHTAIERRLTELTPAGSKLHTGRSRNDQVATDLRLYLRQAGRAQTLGICDLVDALVERAESAGPAVLPGYTHLQRAQPVALANHLLAHAWAFIRDADRWHDCLRRANVSPLGAGALAGSTLPIDPMHTADALGFDAPFVNSLDAVSDRDFVAEALFVCALVQVHCSRIGEEIALWASQEFGFVQLPDEYATGSSMMPQKKNPDVAELARGKAGRVIGDLTGFLATLKGLPLAYNRDLQEDKEPLFDALDTCAGTLSVLTGLIARLEFDTERMLLAARDDTLCATDVAEWLVQQGMPFRETHAVVGELVRRALGGTASFQQLVAADDRLGPDAAALIDPDAAVARRTSPQQITDQIGAVRAASAERRNAIGSRPG